MVLFGSLDDQMPCISAEIIFCLLVANSKMLNIKFLPELMCKFRYNSLVATLSFNFDGFFVLYHNCQFSISGAFQGAIVDVGGSDQCNFIIDDHDFAVDVDDFCYWFGYCVFCYFFWLDK